MNLIRKTKQEMVTLPFEVGKTYDTKICNGWKFTITRIERDPNSDRIRLFYGVYSGTLNDTDTICPLNPDRLIPQQKPSGNIINVCLCPHCDKEINE